VSVAATPHGLTRKSVWRRSKARIDSSWKSPRRTGPRAIPEHRSNTVDVAQSFRIVSTWQKSVLADRIHLNYCQQGKSRFQITPVWKRALAIHHSSRERFMRMPAAPIQSKCLRHTENELVSFWHILCAYFVVSICEEEPFTARNHCSRTDCTYLLFRVHKRPTIRAMVGNLFQVVTVCTRIEASKDSKRSSAIEMYRLPGLSIVSLQ
jgi:hypothetical protein